MINRLFRAVQFRTESRKVSVFKDTLITEKKVEWKREISDTKKKQWKNTDETVYYISTILLSAEEFCKAVKNHRGIENENHRMRDVSMNEDKSRMNFIIIVSE